MSNWTDEEKQDVITSYTDQNPTGDNTIEIVKGIAVDFDKTSNGIRMILQKAGVYVKQAEGSKSTTSGSDKPKRASKADAIAELSEAIVAIGLTPDKDILDKFTGKAALYIASVVRHSSDSE